MKKFNITLCLCLALILSGCESRGRDLLQDPKRLTYYYQTCQNDNRQTVEGFSCDEIFRHHQWLEKQRQLLVTDPQAFGAIILNTQQELGQIELQLANSETNSEVLKQQQAELIARIQQYYAVIRYRRTQ